MYLFKRSLINVNIYPTGYPASANTVTVIVKSTKFSIFASNIFTIANIIFDGSDLHFGFQAAYQTEANLKQ